MDDVRNVKKIWFITFILTFFQVFTLFFLVIKAKSEKYLHLVGNSGSIENYGAVR